MEIVPFEPAHLDALVVQDAQAPELALPRGAAAAMGPTFTAIHDGRVVAIAGLAENHARYATAWALFAEDKDGCRIALARAVRAVIEAADYRRIDMLVRTPFAKAHFFARFLGFSREGEMACMGADGSDFTLYARIRRD